VTQLASGGVSLPAGCKANYDYAGIQQASPQAGIRANLTNLTVPNVGQGHVAGWIGVGGPGLGPDRTDEWVQVGYAGFPGGSTQIYYEVAQPNIAPRYHLVDSSVAANANYLMAVVEVSTDGWQVFINGKPTSPVISLPESSGKFAPQAIGETWNAGTTLCNEYAYGFQNVQITTRTGSTWSQGRTGTDWQNNQQRLVKTAADSFVARSAAGASSRATAGVAAAGTTYQPPLLSPAVSSMLGHHVTTLCVPQSQAVTAQPSTILISTRICSILVGYAVAEPRVPAAYSPAALQVAQAALAFLRGLARASGTVFPNVDCGALERFYTALRPLGVTSAQAAALRNYLFHASIPLYLPHCSVH
jgi:hypothetical protein